MGWSFGNVVFNVTIISVPGGPPAILVYSGSPAHGNLIISLAATSGTDAYGNTYPAGLAFNPDTPPGLVLSLLGGAALIYAPTGLSGELDSPSIQAGVFSTSSQWYFRSGIMSPPNNDYAVLTATSSTNDGATGPNVSLNYVDSAAGVHDYLKVAAAGAAAIGTTTAVTPGTGTRATPATAETWHNASLATGFGASGSPYATPGYQLEGVNGGRVRLRGSVSLTANQAAGTTIFTLPAGYVPTSQKQFLAVTNLSGASGDNSVINITTAGAVQLGVAGTSGNVVRLDQIDFELD